MKCFGPLGLIVISLSLCSSLPPDVTTARYTSAGQNYRNFELPFFPNVKVPLVRRTRVIETSNFNKLDGSNITTNNSLVKDFMINNLDNLRFPNESIEIVTIHKVPQNKTESTFNTNSQKYKIKVVNVTNPLRVNYMTTTEMSIDNNFIPVQNVNNSTILISTNKPASSGKNETKNHNPQENSINNKDMNTTNIENESFKNSSVLNLKTKNGINKLMESLNENATINVAESNSTNYNNIIQPAAVNNGLNLTSNITELDRKPHNKVNSNNTVHTNINFVNNITVELKNVSFSSNMKVKNSSRIINQTKKINNTSEFVKNTHLNTNNSLIVTPKPTVQHNSTMKNKNTLKQTPINSQKIIKNKTTSTTATLRTQKPKIKRVSTTKRPVTYSTKPPFRIQLGKSTPTHRPHKKTTPSTITIHLTKPTTKIPRRRVSNFATTAKPKTLRNNNRNKTKRKPVRRIVKKPGDHASLQDFKQNWADVPVPNPMPEISSHSPQFSIGDVSNGAIDLSNAGVLDDSIFVDAPSEEPPLRNPNPLNTFTLDMIPDSTKQSDGSGCPTVHIASNVLNPSFRQECSDLNLVINSHIHQNSITDRTPLSPPVDTYDSEAVEAPIEDVPIEEAPIEESPLDVANSAPIAPAASPASGGTGGSGGSGGSGGGQNPLSGFSLPDLKGLMKALGWLWEGLGGILKFLSNPYLYIIPITIFFLLGFLTMLALFPWWIPLLLLLLGIKAKKNDKSNVTYYKHVHKPVHHPDGWFWNHQTKTWQNVADYLHHRRVSLENQSNIANIPHVIKNFANKYDQTDDGWKWRRRYK